MALRRTGIGLLVAIAALGALLSGCGSGEDSGSTAARPAAAGFDAGAAYALVKRQVEVGPRPAGSPQLRRLAEHLRAQLPGGRFEPIPAEPGLRNVVGRLPGHGPAIVVAAHYDTLRFPKGFVGANNGAAGTAVVVELAAALQRESAPADPREVRFVLFDGEEPDGGIPETAEEFLAEGLRGSRVYAARHADETQSLILLDYVGNRGLRLPREENSTASLWARVLTAAKRAGAGRFFSSETVAGVLDDHIPFVWKGVPAVDLIDLRYPGQDLRDGLERISPESLGGVGDTMVQLVRELRGE